MSIMPIRDALNAGVPQHAALIFDGGIWDIVGSERIMLDNGFTLTQAYCTDENLKPGAISYNDFTSQLINDDGALTGFNFERKATLLLGVEVERQIVGSFTSVVVAAMRLGNSRVWIVKNGSYQTVVAAHGNPTQFDYLKTESSLCIFAINQSNSDTAFYLFVARKNGNDYQIAKYAIDDDGVVTMVYDYTTFANFSPYAWKRFEKLRDEGICDLYHSTGLVYWNRFQLENGDLTSIKIFFETKTMILGKKPRSTSAKIVLFSGATDTTWLDQNADDYTKATWSSAKTLDLIFSEVANNESLAFGLLPSNVQNISYSTNPFNGLNGLTYRELLSYICEASGVIARENFYAPQLVNDLTFSCSSIWWAPNLSQGNTSQLTLSAEEYYTYNAADFTVDPYNTAHWKQVIPQSGSYVSDIVINPGNTEYIVANNPIADAKTQIISEFLTNVSGYSSGNYKPCTLETHLGMLIDAGDNITIYLEDGSTTRFPVFVNTITWKGGANCVVESTGVEHFNQYDDPSFRSMLQNANQAYRIADNTQPNSSSINVKHDVNRLTGTGDIVDNLRPVTFRYNFDQEDRLHYGLIYEEIVGKYPALVRENPDDTKKRVNYQEIIPILLAEIQDLRKRVKDLETGKN